MNVNISDVARVVEAVKKHRLRKICKTVKQVVKRSGGWNKAFPDSQKCSLESKFDLTSKTGEWCTEELRMLSGDVTLLRHHLGIPREFRTANKPAIYIHWVAHGGTIVARAWPTAACCFSAEGNSKHASNRTPGGRGRREVQSLSVPRARSKCGFFECARDQLCDPQALELVISMQTLRNLQRSCCVQALELVLDRV